MCETGMLRMIHIHGYNSIWVYYNYIHNVCPSVCHEISYENGEQELIYSKFLLNHMHTKVCFRHKESSK